MDIVKCGVCRIVLDQPSDMPRELRIPCPNCGSTTRHIEKSLSVTVECRTSISYKAAHAVRKKRKYFIEGFSGDSLSRKTNRWVKRVLHIDRDNDSYKEVVTDPETGQVIHICEEPLSVHTNHGYAKKNR